MAVNIIDTLAQKNDGDFAVVDSNDVGGGYWQVANEAARLAVTGASYRKDGMLVFQQDDRSTWRLSADLATWEQASLGGGSGLAADVVVYVHPITGTDAPGADRPAALTGGTYTRPFMSVSAARAAVGSNLGSHHADFILAATSFSEGDIFQGMTGPAKGLRVYGTWGTAALTAVAGTGTSTSQVQRLGGSAWTPGAYKDKFFVPTAGGGYGDAGPNEAGAVIYDNDANFLYLRQPVAGIDSTTNYKVVSPGTIITGVAAESYPDLSFFTMGLGFLDMSVEAVVRRVKFDNSLSGFFGLFTEANALVDVRLCEFASGEHWFTYDKHLNLNDCVVAGGSHIFAYGETKIDSYGTVVDGGQLELDTYDKATVDYASFLGCTATAFKASYGDDLTLGAAVKNNGTTPIVLRNFGYMRLGSLGLSGANASAHYAVDMGGNGVAELAGIVVSASGANQVLLENTEVDYTTLALGTTRKNGTVVVWGSGAERLLQKIFVKADPSNLGDEISTDGDLQVGGQQKNYGFDNELGNAYDVSASAAGNTAAASTPLSYRTTVIDEAAASANGVHLLFGGVAAAAGGHTGKAYNVSGYDLALWPSWSPAGWSPAVTGSINGGAAGASASFPNNHIAIFNSVSEASHRVAFVPMTDGLSDYDRAQWFGDGSDGTVAVTGAVTLSRDMYYDNLTISGSGSLTTNGYVVFVKHLLDLSAAAAGAVKWVGSNATAPTTQAGGTGQNVVTSPALYVSHLIGVAGGARNGGIAGTSPGAGGASANQIYNTTVSGSGGAGGASSTGVAGGAGGGVTSSFQRLLKSLKPMSFCNSAATANSEFGGVLPGGGGGGGKANNSGATTGGGGGGGANGGMLSIYARIIKRDSSGTATGAIAAYGTNGANGANGNVDGSSAAIGGGGGGGGGAGGLVHLAYEYLTGTAKSNLIDVSGGAGGAGGNCVAGTPGSATGGTGGGGGGGGSVVVHQVPGTPTRTTGTTGTSGSGPTGVTGGAGGAGETLQVTL